MTFKTRALGQSTTTGTGTLTLTGSSITGYQDIGAAFTVGQTFDMMIVAVNGSGQPTGEWEECTGTLATSSTVTRTSVTASSNSGSAVNFGAGNKYVYCTPSSARLEQIGSGASTSSNNTWTKAQRGSITALTDGTTITPDFNDNNFYSVTLGGNRTLANPTNIVAGQSGSIFITQDGTGSRTLAYGSYFKFPFGSVPTLTTTASAVDRLDYIVETTTRIHASLTKGVA